MTADLPALLAEMGAKGLRLAVREDRLGVLRPDRIGPDEVAPLRADPAAVKSAVARMDARLAKALAILDDLAARPGTTPARLNVIRLRAEVYLEYRARLDPTDLAEDAKRFAHSILNPPPRDHDWLLPRDCRPPRPTQETTA